MGQLNENNTVESFTATASSGDDRETTASCSTEKASNESKSILFRPLHPLIALSALPLLPSWFFLNRGYTQWFHWMFVFCAVTGKTDFWRRFLVIQGLTVTVGWYAAVTHDYLTHDRLCHLLYNNMPSAMKELMFVNGISASGGIIIDTIPAWSMIATSHVIDFLGHPYLTFVAWKMHTASGGSMRNLVTWDVFWLTMFLSRVYSITHIYYNEGKVTGLFYYGFDVYNIDSLATYTAAYMAEGLCFAALAAWKVYLHWSGKLQVKIRVGNKATIPSYTTSNQVDGNDEGASDRQKPRLIQSDSCFSSQSSSLSDSDDQ